MTTDSPGFSTRRIPLRDGAVFWTAVGGSGPPVVCCHGGPGLWDYLAPLAALLVDSFTVVRFDQRGCGRSTGGGPFTIAQAVDDLDQLRAGLGIDRWTVIGHSWGAELALRYAASRPERASGVVYISGVGSDDAFRPAYIAERNRRLGESLDRWRELGARERTPAEEREWCLLQWRPDFSPGSAVDHARALWDTRPPGTAVNMTANRELWADRASADLLQLATTIGCPVRMIFGDDDPRPWTATDRLLDALPRADRIVLRRAGHAPWAERPDATRRAILGAPASTFDQSEQGANRD